MLVNDTFFNVIHFFALIFPNIFFVLIFIYDLSCFCFFYEINIL